jgi:predicted RNA-binding Zn-ribbon protein involved in translation (DUF1610 family)
MKLSDNKHIYHYSWNATCPRCKKELTNQDFYCSNCHRGNYQIEVTNEDDYTYMSGYSCNICRDGKMTFTCPECGADITNQIRKTRAYSFKDLLLGFLILVCTLGIVRLIVAIFT